MEATGKLTCIHLYLNEQKCSDSIISLHCVLNLIPSSAPVVLGRLIYCERNRKYSLVTNSGQIMVCSDLWLNFRAPWDPDMALCCNSLGTLLELDLCTGLQKEI